MSQATHGTDGSLLARRGGYFATFQQQRNGLGSEQERGKGSLFGAVRRKRASVRASERSGKESVL
jgi:hypothetical protein